MPEHQPKFFKEFTKQNAADERSEVAHQARAERAEHRRTKQNLESAQERHHGEYISLSAEAQKKVASLHRLGQELERRRGSLAGQIFDFLKIRSLEAQMQTQRQELSDIESRKISAKDKAGRAEEQLQMVSEAPDHLQRAARLVQSFYQRQERAWREQPVRAAETAKLFTEEHLASLSLRDYQLLLQRFPSQMVTHVTRQGIRDHIGMVYHSAGMGAMHNGFKRIIEDGRLRSPLGMMLEEEDQRQAVGEMIFLPQVKSREEALRELRRVSGNPRGGSGTYADRAAIHFAAEEVADTYYGSETGNEIFFAFPSAHVASQHYHSGTITEGGGGYHNDTWVWTQEQRGIDINAGVTFIPEGARVDRKTGSRYEIDAEGRPVLNQEYIDQAKTVVTLPAYEQIMTERRRIWSQQTVAPVLERDQNDRALRQQVADLQVDTGIADSRLAEALLEFHFDSERALRFQARREEKSYAVDWPADDGDLIEQALRHQSILYKETSDPVSSHDYWEEYFTQQPDRRPSKVVYYQGADPTEALHRWQNESLRHRQAPSPDLGFPERVANRTGVIENEGIERFDALAQDIIDQYFPAALNSESLEPAST